ncbi:isocitrate lyase/phosphoenolpyruvate mutase family protein [Candidatus Bathyarchaeota archaeon]|nr:MAG: isocitrate lyase/phosphoenolpyruvate mutase family protein [Candidatus Bathyarchaeota archaeon]
MKSQREKALKFRGMHLSGDMLVLANAWDVPSARIFEQAGFPAIGTTSAGIALSLGYPDGQKISRDEMMQVVARIARSVSIPVTADVEAGYGESVADVAKTAMRVISAGAVGLNLEDSTKRPENPLYDVETQIQKIRMIGKVASSLEVPLVVNARTDVLVLGKGDSSNRLKDAIARGKEYRKAGADCFFPVGAIDPQTISEIVKQVSGPVNILAAKDVPPVAELKRLGVRRVSVGSGPARATLGLVKRIAQELRESGTYGNLLEGAPTLAEANRLVERNSELASYRG